MAEFERKGIVLFEFSKIWAHPQGVGLSATIFWETQKDFRCYPLRTVL